MTEAIVSELTEKSFKTTTEYSAKSINRKHSIIFMTRHILYIIVDLYFSMPSNPALSATPQTVWHQ